ncbi:MAG: hypothetical protein ACTHM5_06060 [Ginsengibacter sp.]
MKKIVAISLLSLYLFSTTELSQLLKTPVLIQHFVEHREENKHLTLWQFLYLHYATSHGEDADHHKDRQLPFKTHHNCIAAFQNVVVPASNTIHNPVVTLENRSLHPDDQFISSSSLSNIWQPPRFC